MHVLLNLEHRAGLLHLHAEADVDVLGLQGFLLIIAVVRPEVSLVVSVLHELSCPYVVELGVDAGLHELLVQFVRQPVLTREIHHRTCLAVLRNQVQRRHTCSFSHTFVIRTEGRCDMYDTRTVLGGHIVAADDAESVCTAVGDKVLLLVVVNRLHPGEELLVTQSYQV